MYLVQRGTIETASIKKNSPDHRFSKVTNLDYMGSAEFEWGALPQSLRRMGEQLDNAETVVMDDITNADGQSLRVYYGSNTLHKRVRPDFVDDLHKLRAGKKRLKEYSAFEANFKPYGSRETDLWWDVDNDVMWSFNKKFMNKLPIVLKNSIDFMNAQKEQENQ